jgi:hypothetical protein
MTLLRDNVYLRVLHVLQVTDMLTQSSTKRQHVPSLSPCLNAALLAECTWIRPRLPRLHSFIKEMPSWYRNPTVRPHTSHCALRTVKSSKSAPVQWDRLAACLCCITSHPSLAVQVGSAWMSQILSPPPSKVVSTVIHYTMLAPSVPKSKKQYSLYIDYLVHFTNL